MTAEYLNERIAFEQVGIKDMAILDASVVSSLESFDLTVGAWEHTTTFNPYNNFKLKMIKIKSVNPIVNEVLKIESVESNVLYNTVLFKETVNADNSITVTFDDKDFIAYKTSQMKISLSNNNTVGNIYVTMYFNVI